MLFLDEPTSGLDSASSFSIMQSLRRYAKATKTPLLVTIHQPSELLFELGDKLLLLSGGKEVYFGPIGEVERHFNEIQFHCPPRTSIAEWLLDLVNRDFGENEVVDRCLDFWPKSKLKKDLDDKMNALGVPMSVEPLKKSYLAPLPYRTNQFLATWTLFKRGFLNALRSPGVIWLRMAMYFMLSILIGTVWLQLGNSVAVINAYNGALFYTTAFMIFMSISVLPMYLEERAVFIRERSNASYGVMAYILSHLCFELPFVFLLSLICSSLVYWLVGMFPDGSRFMIFVANLFMGLMVAESIMVLIAAAIPYFIVGIAVGAFTFGAFMCVMGYFVEFSSIGWWWKWMRYIAVHYYNFSTFMSNQHEGQVYKGCLSQPCPSSCVTCTDFDIFGGTLISQYELEGRVWVNFLVQLLMIIVFRVLAGVYLHIFIRGKK
jgi:ABC-type multidrug transport system permease subunit